MFNLLIFLSVKCTQSSPIILNINICTLQPATRMCNVKSGINKMIGPASILAFTVFNQICTSAKTTSNNQCQPGITLKIKATRTC